MHESEKVKIWFTGYNIKGKYLLVFSDGILIDRLQITKRALVFKFFVESVKFEYFRLKLKKIPLLKVILRKIINDKQQNKLNYIFGYQISIPFVADIGVLSFSVEGDPRTAWTSRSSINNGVKPFSMSHSIEYDFERFPDNFSVLIWGISWPFKRNVINPIIGFPTKLPVLETEIKTNLPNSPLTFYEVEKCSILHSMLPVVDGIIFPTDAYNFIDDSWPCDRAMRLNGRIICVAGPNQQAYFEEESVFFGSSTSWYHFLIEVFPRYLKFGVEKMNNKTPVVEHDLPKSILEVLKTLTTNTPIKIFPFETANFQKIHLSIDARFPEPFNLQSREEDILLVQKFFRQKFNLNEKTNFRKIFILRNKNLYRSSKNLYLVIDFFKQYNFEFIDPGTLSMSEQIEIFSQARIIVGETGAAMTSLLFCSNKCQVIEINLHNWFLPRFFGDFCDILNIRHTSVEKINYKSGKIIAYSDGQIIDLHALIL
jgi:hypothetical protein